MTPERFQQIEELYHAAREGSAAERVALLSQAEPELRSEVESLLAVRIGGEFMDRPAVQNSAQLLQDLIATEWTAGARLGPYRIESKLGEGGMGQVFRAVDTRLGRAVAIKITPQEFSSRFEREARAISSLNHPNICTLYDVGPNYLVMELVEGETLAARLKQGPMPIELVRHYGGQIAAALEEAHAKGIVHRDLKPGNIMIAKSAIKILDFGLAKSGKEETLTISRMVMGTPAYMSPEQREGRPTDARTDIYSFGCVLHEMSTGARIDSKIGAQRKRIPSPKLEKIVSRCVQEDPAGRWQSVAELEPELATISPAPGPWKRIVAGATAIVAIFAGAWFFLHRPPKLTDKDTIVLADFVNKTGDPIFDSTLQQGLAIQLQQSPFLSLISELHIQQTLKMMGRPADARLTPEISREICERTGSAAVLQGSIASLGSQYVLGLRAENCRNGDMLDEEQAQAASKEDVLKAVDSVAIRLRSKLGESLGSVQKYAKPLEEATTPSLEALKAYSLGRQVYFAKGNTAALPFLKRAVELDPNFAIAYRAMSAAYGNLNQPGRMQENIRKAYELRERASERERFYIEANYYWAGTGELEKALPAYELWRQTYPRDYALYNHLGLIYASLGNLEKALEEARESTRLEPNLAGNYEWLGRDYINLGRPDEAEAVFKQAEERKLENEGLLELRYKLAFLRGDTAQMAQAVSAAMGKPGMEDFLLANQANTQAWYGRLKDARELTRRAMLSAERNDSQEGAAIYQAKAALFEAEAGKSDEARADAFAAIKLAPNPDVLGMAAMALALAGNNAAVARFAAELDRNFPLDTLVQLYRLPAISAAVAMRRKDPKRAIELLQMNTPIELGDKNWLLPVYVRGEAYLMLHDGHAAAAEFQKFVDHPGLVGNFPWGALARLQLARAYMLSGDKIKAKSAYQDFLTLWKDADPDITIFQQAKAEYAKLP